MIEPREHLRPIYRTSERDEGRAEFICLDRNERASPIADDVFRAMMASVSVRDLMAYPDAGPLVSRLARVLGLPESWIAETAGSDNAIRRTFMAYLRPGAAVVSPSPSYAMYDIYTRIFQGTPRQIVYEADGRLDVSAMVATITPDVGIVVLANPDQPMGAVLPAADVERVIARAADAGAVCLVDEAYFPFHSETVVLLVRRFENLIVVRTFSKYPGCAGIRLGYAVAQPNLIEGLMKVRGGNEVSGVSLALGCHLLDHPEIAEDFRRAVEIGRQAFNAQARSLGFETPLCVANFQLLRCPAWLTPSRLAAALERRRFLVKTGFTHPAIADCIRVSLNGVDVMQPFAVALSEAVRELQSA